jgi:1,2-diacylglycerol 3-alpha-glucosyltransferase
VQNLVNVIMRIAYLSHTYPPILTGVSTVMHNLTEGMHARGHTTMAIVSSDIGKPYLERGSVKVHRLRSLPAPINVDYRIMPFALRQISQELENFRPDIVHVHDPILAWLAAKIKLDRDPAWPLVYTVHLQPGAVIPHIPDIWRFREIMETRMIKYGAQILDCCQAIISPSHFLAQYILEQSGRTAHVISNGVDPAHFNPNPASAAEPLRLREKYHLHPTLPVLLSVGRLSEEKNLDTVLRAAAEVMQEEDAQLVVVGEGGNIDYLMALAQSLGIGQRTHFAGLIERDHDLPGIYRLADVFLIASEVEAQGLVVMESLATGVPVVAVDASAVPELIDDGVNGFLVSPKDSLTMAERVITVLRSEDIAGELRFNARRSIESHSIETTLRSHEKLYQSVLETSMVSPGLRS